MQNVATQDGKGPVPMRILISFAALFLSVLMLQLSTGGVGPLDAISGLQLGFTTGQIGLLGSAHFVGFFIGCWWAPRLMGTVGHSRAFAAFTAAGTIGLLSHMLVVDAYAWSLMRIAAGFCVAGCYTVIESWLQSKVTNATRGRTMGIYRVVDLGGSLGAQLVIGVLEPASYVSYNILAIICCAALLPLTLSTARQPETSQAPRLRPILAFQLSPLAAFAVLVAGLTAAAFRMVGPVYGQEVGLPTDEIALFLAAFVLGSAISQIPVGWLADRFDRRNVLIWLSVASILASVLTAASPLSGTVALFVTTILFGATTAPIYSVAAAHAHDFAEDSQRVELSAALMFFYALGAIASPLLASTFLDLFGPRALFAYIAAAHAALIVTTVLRARVRPTSDTRTDYIYIPRTSFLVGRIFRRRSSPRTQDPDDGN